MKKGMWLLLPLLMWASVFGSAFLGADPLLSRDRTCCLVLGQIKILNPKIKLPDGSADSSGVAVWLVPIKATGMPGLPQMQKRTLEQRDKRFVPHIMVIQVGTEVDFPNFDPFFHNVFSVYDGKRFDLGLYANGESRPVRFNRPGISHIFCNIHPQMSAVIVTVETPYFGISAPDGNFSIENVPVGTYRLHLWHERSDDQQLAAESRIVSVESSVLKLDVIQLDEAAYVPAPHKNKNGQDYESDRNLPDYRRP